MNEAKLSVSKDNEVTRLSAYNPGSSVNLFCLPYAGGSAYSYKGFLKSSPNFLEIFFLELSGRGIRAKEPLLKSLDHMVDDLMLQIKPKVAEPYAIYGHSMGALLGYLLTKRMIEAGNPAPLHLFFTGCTGPSVNDIDRGRHLLPQDQFIQKLRELNGSPEEILSDPILMAYFEPIIRSDFEAVDNYEYEESEPFSDLPITIINGLNEKATYEHGMAWQKETTEKIDFRQFPGKHFFIYEYQHELMKIITNKLIHQNRQP